MTIISEKSPFKLSVIGLLYLAKHGNERPYSEDELIEKLAIPRTTAKRNLWVWEHRSGVIKREESHDGSLLYHLTEAGEYHLAYLGRIPVRKPK